MLRSTAFIAALAVLLAAAPGEAQVAQPGGEASPCARAGFSVYYARGDATPSEQARFLITRIGEEAKRCMPARIDVVTEVDSVRDGENAIGLAMTRLGAVAEAIVAEGYPPDRIRLAAQAGTETSLRLPMGGITVYFRQPATEAGDASASAPTRRPVAPQSTI